MNILRHKMSISMVQKKKKSFKNERIIEHTNERKNLSLGYLKPHFKH